MALVDDVQTRYSSAYLIQITNPDDTDAESVNTTKIEDLTAEVLADFETGVQEEYDATDVRHVRLACRLMEVTLIEYGGGPGSASLKKRERCDKDIEALRGVTSRARVTPSTTSQYQHSVKSTTPRPEFDDEQFEDIIPRAPGRDSDDY